jgi:hypothetical protein
MWSDLPGDEWTGDEVVSDVAQDRREQFNPVSGRGASS